MMNHRGGAAAGGEPVGPDPTKVNVAGDTMTGPLVIEDDDPLGRILQLRKETAGAAGYDYANVAIALVAHNPLATIPYKPLYLFGAEGYYHDGIANTDGLLDFASFLLYDQTAGGAEAVWAIDNKGMWNKRPLKVGGAFFSIDAKAVLDVESTTMGALLPRMTTAQRDAMGAVTAGMTVYNTTTNRYNFWNGASWRAVVDEAA